MGFKEDLNCSHYPQYVFAVVSYSIVKGQHIIRKTSGHRIWKKYGVEVEEGTEMRSVKSVMERNDVGGQLRLIAFIARLI